jgi:hypothetical protein
MTYCWKALDKGYNFALDLILIRGLHAKLWGLKVARVPTLAISRLPLGNPGTKCHLDVNFMERHRVYTIRGKVVASPSLGRGESCESKLPVICFSTKSVPTMH